MRYLKSLIMIIILIALVNTTVLAKSEYVEVDVGDNSVGITVPTNYKYITDSALDKPATYFKNMPIDKNEAIDRINNNGVVIDAFSDDDNCEIKLTVTSDKFSKTIGNFSPMDDTDKASVIKTFKSGIEQSGHDFLSEPEIVTLDGYDFVKYNCRIGNGDNGYSYESIMTIIGEKCYELTCYTSMSIPDDETKTNFKNIIESLKLDIKGESSQIFTSVFQSIIAVIVIIVAAVAIICLIYSLVKQFLAYKNRGDKVKLKRRK